MPISAFNIALVAVRLPFLETSSTISPAKFSARLTLDGLHSGDGAGFLLLDAQRFAMIFIATNAIITRATGCFLV